MGEMRSSRRTEASLKNSSQLLNDHNIGTELTTAWKSLAQSKAALRHIENRLEATPGTGVFLDSVTDSPKKKASRIVGHREGQRADDFGRSSKLWVGSQQSPAKGSSRSPLRNTTQDSNVCKKSSVEFREPLASYREATPPPHLISQLEAHNLQSTPGTSCPSSPPHSDPLSSQLVYDRDTRDRQTERDLDSTHSSALESTEVRYLNDHPALDVLKTEEGNLKAQLVMDSQESGPCVTPHAGSSHRRESTPSTSPGSASQRLENLKRHQPDDKLEKLKERIRRQRQHLEEAAERERLEGHLEQPIAGTVESNDAGLNTMPTAKIRKVASARPAPVYKGFNSTETKIKTPDGRVWKEEQFHNLSREIYRDLSRQFAERTRHQQQTEQRERSKEKRPSKPVRKVHRVAPVSDLHSKPVISPASWREGQKLVQMVLGPVPKVDRKDNRSCLNDRQSRTASSHRSEPHSDSNRHGTEKPRGGFQGQPTGQPTTSHRPISSVQDAMPLGISTDLLSADIKGILDDLQLDCKPAEREERARKRSHGGSSSRRGRRGSGSRSRTPVSAWGTTVVANSSSRGCRSASPTTRQSDTTTADRVHKKRHYDADTVRQYIARQQEERKRRQAEEKQAMKEEAEKRNQRLQELYKKQREVAKTVAPTTEATVVPVQKRLQETYTKLLMEEAQLGEETPQIQLAAASIQMRPMYQPSGESDKENKRLEAPQSPSSSDKSLNDQPPPPLSRNDLDVGVASFLEPDPLYPAFQSTTGPSSNARTPANEHLFSQLLRLEAAVAAGNPTYAGSPATAPSNRFQSKMSRIEALKATATSLSNRIENEARKLAGKGINCGATTSLDVDPILASRTSNLDARHWAETPANGTENDVMSQRIQRSLTSKDYSSYSSTALPGAGNLHDLREKKERTHRSFNNPHIVSADIKGLELNSYTKERKRIGSGLEMEERMDKAALTIKNNKEEKWADLHDSSAGSISEGPLLSEGSFSEVEASPPHRSINSVPGPDRLEAVDHSVNQRKDQQRLVEFQKEAAMCSALNPPFSQLDSSKTPWEELNKGSPLSVINIFTKNHHENVQVNERNSERNSPPAHPLHTGNVAVYEDDFVSSQSSKASDQLKRRSNSPSHFEELVRRSPFEKSTGVSNSHHSPYHSSSHSQHISSGSASGSSPLSRHSSRKRGTASDQSDATLVEEQRSSCSPFSDALSSESRKRSSDKSSAHNQSQSVHSNDILGESSEQSPQRARFASPSGSPHPVSPPGAGSLSETVRRGSAGANNPNTGSSAYSGKPETRPTGGLQYSPAVLQLRMAAELQYLESIEESIQQLGDVERLMGVSMAQHESVSLAQMLKAKQHRHDRDLYELKIKAEREALETKLQLEENRQRVARAHIELQESLAASQKETLETLQESTTKMMSQQAEAARHTADAARHIKEMTELARSQMAGAMIVPPVTSVPVMLDQQDEQDSSYSKQREDKPDSDSEVSSRRARSEKPISSLNSLSRSESLSFRRPHLSDAASSSSHQTPSQASSGHRERTTEEVEEEKQRNGRAEQRLEREAASSSVEEDVHREANGSLYSDSIPSIVDEKGESTSVATEYSLKFDESMTEDEIEEHSFRSLLPSEAHRRGTMEKKSRHQEESEDDGASHNAAPVSGMQNTFKSQDVHIAFSGGQDSFSQFTMDMVRQYMKDEEVRLQHQSSLLHLRQKALKEKTRTELAWLELQKKRLRDKGEDDKMPPIRKKQRGLLIKLQQEQAEIKRLQEANKAARKERRQLLKQQEEIERMRNSTLRLKERLKCAEGEAAPDTPVSEPPESESVAANVRLAEDVRSPSPSLSVSGSETSSIMQKLKKMRSHMDEKFLTKREQQLMQRRHHAEELLQWKQRLDQEEAEVRKIEKKALAAWDRKRPLDKNLPESQEKEISEINLHPSHHQSSEPRTDSEKELVSEVDCCTVTPESSIHTEGLDSQPLGSPTSARPASISETPLASVQSSPANYTQDFTSGSQPASRKSSPLKGSLSSVASPSDGSSKTKMQLCTTSRATSEAFTQPPDPPMAMPSDTTSDQSDIESRIKALREELRKRKFMAYQLKKEQKKRHKERLKAQEASLLKQLENYNNFIEKTQAELNKEPESTPDTNSQIKDPSSILEQSSVKPSLHRSDTSKSSRSERTITGASLNHNAFPQQDRSSSTSVPNDLSDKEPVTPTVLGGPQHATPGQRSHQSSESLLRPSSMAESGDNKVLSDNRSDVQEELELDVSSRLEDEHSQHLLKLEKQDSHDSSQKLSTPEHAASLVDQEHHHSSISLEEDKQIITSKLSVLDEDVASNIPSSGPPHSAAVNLETSPRSPDGAPVSSNKEAPTTGVETSVADGYHDDFESTDSSPRDNSKPLSPTEAKVSKRDSYSGGASSDSQDEVVEEEIAEELSKSSDVSEHTHLSGILLDLDQQKEDLKHDKSINSSQTSPISPLQGPPSPVADEMPSFNIGDRVLVGGVQPGTLRFKGPTSFANGFWAGLELDKSEGSNNGTYDGVVYFECKDRHGIFAPPDKISHLPDKFELYADTTEDDDSFFDDLSDKDGNQLTKSQDNSPNQGNLENKNEQGSHKDTGSGGRMMDEENQAPPKDISYLNSQHHKESRHLITNGNAGDIILDSVDTPQTFFISDADQTELVKQTNKEKAALTERDDTRSQQHFTPAEFTPVIKPDGGQQKDRDMLDTCADKLLNNFVKDTVKQFADIKKAKEEKIRAANQMNGWMLTVSDEEDTWITSVGQKDGLPFFLPAEKQELSSPDLCNRPESPVFGAIGQEELAKRLAELELSRELFDDHLADDQDWFDEDFGLSSRREQQRLKQKEEEQKLGGEPLRSASSTGPPMGGMVSSFGGEPPVKTPPRPELPLPLPPKLPEQPAMVVPHSANEVKKMVHAATKEIWDTFDLGKEGVLISDLPSPTPSLEYLGNDSSSQDQEGLSIRSYKKAVYDLTWEILQEIYAEDPNTDQPQWVKPCRVKSSLIHRVKTSGDINRVQEFVTTEVLKLYGMTQDQNQKTDWQKMLKFGRKKRDRVDHILVHELHEEEAQWVNYDEDELLVKMQLADSIFDALIKDTVNVFALISEKKSKRDAPS